MTRQLKATGAVKVGAQGFKALNKGFSSMAMAEAGDGITYLGPYNGGVECEC